MKIHVLFLVALALFLAALALTWDLVRLSEKKQRLAREVRQAEILDSRRAEMEAEIQDIRRKLHEMQKILAELERKYPNHTRWRDDSFLELPPLARDPR